LEGDGCLVPILEPDVLVLNKLLKTLPEDERLLGVEGAGLGRVVLVDNDELEGLEILGVLVRVMDREGEGLATLVAGLLTLGGDDALDGAADFAACWLLGLLLLDLLDWRDFLARAGSASSINATASVAQTIPTSLRDFIANMAYLLFLFQVMLIHAQIIHAEPLLYSV
jgi:hypothetical protein